MKGGLVHRSRLFEQLARGQRARLTLVVGSPGAGKTALLADWVTTRPERPLAWLSCDVADADPVRFIAAVIEALQRAPGRSDVGEDARQLLSLDGEVSADVIAALADDLERQDGAGVLVIDDFHLTGGAGTDALALLLEYSPPSLQLVVASRVDPQLRLYRMRANQELVELRDGDLSFSAEETETFLSRFGVRLSEETWPWSTGAAKAGRRAYKWRPSRSTNRLTPPAPPVGWSCTAIAWPATSWTRSSTVSHRRSSTSCWPRPSSTSCRCPPAPPCAVRGRPSCSSWPTAPTCS